MSATIPYAPATYLVYRADTGAVVGRRFNDPFTVADGTNPGDALIEVEPTSIGATLPLPDLCVIAGVPTARAVPPIVVSALSIAADGVAECSVSGIPAGTRAVIRGAVSAGPVILEADTFILTSTAPGQIVITLDCPPPWRRWEGRVDAF